MNKAQYQEYLRSEWWQKFRSAAVIHADGLCQLCGESSPLDVHHRTYNTLGREKMHDVVVLCRACHEKHHGKSNDINDLKETVELLGAAVKYLIGTLGPKQLLDYLRWAGFSISKNGDFIRFRPSPGPFTEARLKDLKPEIMDLLTAEEGTDQKAEVAA